MIEIYNEDCLLTMQNHLEEKSIDIILTSPFYATNKKSGKNRTLLNTNVQKQYHHYLRYDEFVDNYSNEEYCDFTVKLFRGFDRILKTDGVVLYNINYGGENTEGMFLAIADVLRNTDFTIGDVICWRKRSAIPNNVSANKLTRIWEFVFVLCRRSEFFSYRCNKREVGRRESGQTIFENKFNYLEADNNDGVCPYNKATFSTDLCRQLLALYAIGGGNGVTVYDPFMGSGTTAAACKELGFNCFGSEISQRQCEFAEERLSNTTPSLF